MKKKTVEYYLRLPYTIQVIRETDPDDPGFVARVTELPGCITQADTMAELEGMIEDAMRAWITVALEEGLEIPEPRPDDDYSGKFVVRIPKSLHRRLVQDAENEGVSLNQLVNTYLAGAVGHKNQATFSDMNLSIIKEIMPRLDIYKQRLQEAGFKTEAKPPEKHQISVLSLYDYQKIRIRERIEEDPEYQEWMSNAGLESPSAKLSSTTLEELSS